MTTPDRFEDRLLSELRAVVAATPTPAPPAAVGAAARRRSPVLRSRPALAGAVAAAAAAALVVQSGGSHPDAAYAVTQRADGMVTVQIRSLRDAAGLEQALRAKGVPAEVDYADAAMCPGGMPAPPPPGAAAEKHTVVRGESGGPRLSSAGGPPPTGAAKRRSMSGMVRVGSDGSVTFGVDPGELTPGEKVWITTSGPTASSVSMAVGTAQPANPPCKPGG